MQSPDKKPGLSWSTPAQSASTAKASQANTEAPVQKTLKAGAVKSNTATYAGIFVVGIVIGVLVAWGYGSLRGRGTVSATASSSAKTVGTTPTTTAGTKTTPVAAEQTGSDLSVLSPQKAGQSVVISQAKIAEPTWVVVYEDRDGKPGNVLGAQLFFTSGPGIVTLLRATEAGQTYYVGTSVDNGDRKYTKATDKATVNADGSLAVTSFRAN